MTKKPQAINTKVLAIGGGVIVLLALLLVGAYGERLKTQLGIGAGRVLIQQLDSPECTAAYERYNNAKNRFGMYCMPPILSVPSVPSPECNKAFIDLTAAERDIDEFCEAPAPPIAPPAPGPATPGLYVSTSPNPLR